MSYDLLVIGAGPAGWSAALQGAKLGLNVAVAENSGVLGGACVHTGTLPSKTLRHTILQLIAMRRASHIGIHSTHLRPLTIQDLMGPKNSVIENHQQTIRSFFDRNKIKVLNGTASFVAPQEVRIVTRESEETVHAKNIVIATGSRPRRPSSVPFDDRVICDSDTILDLDTIPRSMAVMGGGVIGCEYACMFAAVGVKVSLIDRRQTLLRFLDEDMLAALSHSMRRMGVRLYLGEDVQNIDVVLKDRIPTAAIGFASGRSIRVDRVMVAAGRESSTTALNLDRVGIPTDETGLIKVDEHHRTTTDNIYAVGDVIGFPALASTSMHQGRLAVLHAAGMAAPSERALPVAIYTIPEISFIGVTEQECRDQEIPYEVGFARYGETPRGQIQGDADGQLKLIFRRDNQRIIGVHLIGQSSSELVHIGMILLNTKSTLDEILASVFNYPTISEAYRIAALDGINRL